VASRAPIELGGHGVRFAAVAAVVRITPGGTETLLMRRAESPLDPWSGHMSFPGGRQDPEDLTLLDTARRETKEETGLDLLESAQLIGQLDDLQAVARGATLDLVIRPFVFELREPRELAPNYEVAELVWAPIEPMRSGRLDTVWPYVHRDQRWDLPAFDVGGRIVWGLTHRILVSLFTRLP
jgi:8-oxo-dGTP pyrophosphatase MutT (NUDIX family)